MNPDGHQIFQHVTLLGVLALFMVSLGGHMAHRAWFKRWEADRKARREAELDRDVSAPSQDRPRRGPWG